MSEVCRAGGTDRAQVQRAARSLRLRAPKAAVDTFDPSGTPHRAWGVEVTIPDADGVRAEVYGALEDETLQIRDVSPQGEHMKLIATA